MTAKNISLQKFLPVFLSFVVMGFFSMTFGLLVSMSVVGMCMLYILWASFYVRKA